MENKKIELKDSHKNTVISKRLASGQLRVFDPNKVPAHKYNYFVLDFPECFIVNEKEIKQAEKKISEK